MKKLIMFLMLSISLIANAATNGLSDSNVDDVPGVTSASANAGVAGQTCPAGMMVTGFDLDGQVVCSKPAPAGGGGGGGGLSCVSGHMTMAGFVCSVFK